MNRATLTLRYRPKRYSEVIGQEVPVEFLSGLSRSKGRRHILLYGSVGSGKTTLARIYARSLHCEALSPDGSPCNSCGECKSTDTDATKFVELDAPSFETAEDFRARLRSFQQPRPSAGKARVIFVDEAHSLRRWPASTDILLKELERDANEITYIFATTQPLAISNALKSRMAELRVQPISLEQGKRLLEGILNSERRRGVEEEALSLIWGLGDGQPRNMVQALETLTSIGDGAVTRDKVRKVFGIADTKALIAYLVALGNAEFEQQGQVFFAWSGSVRHKISMIQSALVSLYYNDLMGVTVTVNPVVASIKREEREPIIDAFAQRFNNKDSLRCAWIEMLGLLPTNPEELPEQSLLSSLALFQERVCQPDLGKSWAGFEEFPDEEKVSRQKTVSRASKVERDPRYLDAVEVRKIYGLASAYAQMYGRQFNLQIRVRHERFGCRNQHEAGSNAGSFSNQLGQWLKRRFGFNDRMLIQEHDEKLGPCVRIVTLLPDPALMPQLRGWMAGWSSEKRIGERNGDAFAINFVEESSEMNSHWECVRWLCAGALPAEAQRLRISSHVAGDIGNGTRFASSDSCGVDLIKAAAKTELPFLSAFDCEDRSVLYSGWELQAFELRREAGIAAEPDRVERLKTAKNKILEFQEKLGLVRLFE